MIDKTQIEILYEVLYLFQKLGLNRHIALIGSWVEFFYDEFFKDDYYPEIATRDIDFLYRNLRIPDYEIPLVESLKEYGFIYDEHPLSKTARFYKEGIVELEFMTRVIGQDHINYEIESIGIIAEGLRDLNLLDKHCVEIHRNGFSVFIPQPAAYVVHKILINEKRMKQNKNEKDMRSIKNLLGLIKRNDQQKLLLKSIIQSLTVKEKNQFNKSCTVNKIDLNDLNT